MAGENQGPAIVGVTVLTLVLSCVVIFARVVTRTIIRPGFGMDDVLIVVTLFFFIGFNTSELVAVHYGFGRHFTEISPDNALAALRASVIGEFLAVWTYPTGKAAVAYLLMRLFPGKTLRWVLWPIVAVNVILFYLNGVFFLVQCSPVAYQWNKSIQGGTCWNHLFLVYWGYVTGSVGAATDFAFAVIPWFYIAKLQMSFRKKIAVSIALSAGLFPFICSILKIYYTSTLGASADPTYSTVNLVFTGEAELCAINIAACIPTLRPLYLWCRGKNDRSFADPYSAQTRGQRTYEVSPGLLGGRSKKPAPGVLLRSFDHRSDRMLQLRSRDGSGED